MKTCSIDLLASEAKAKNSTLKNSALRAELVKNYQLAWASAFPQLSINGGYSCAKSQGEAGIVLSNIAVGWNGSIALLLPAF